MRKFIGENIPVRQTKGSAGYDISIIVEEDTIIPPNQTKVFNTGVKVEMNEGDLLLIFARSSLGFKRNIILVNSVACIDSDFKDEIRLALTNVGIEAQHFEKGVHRVAQGVFVNFLKTDDDKVTAKRKGGIGSTGDK